MNKYGLSTNFSMFYAALLATWPELPDNTKTAELAIRLMVTLDRAYADERSSLPPIVDGGPNEGTGFPSY